MRGGVDLREGWELRPWCGERGVDHEIDADHLIATLLSSSGAVAEVVARCARCGLEVYTVVDAESREHLLNLKVTVEPFVILEEEF